MAGLEVESLFFTWSAEGQATKLLESLPHIIRAKQSNKLEYQSTHNSTSTWKYPSQKPVSWHPQSIPCNSKAAWMGPNICHQESSEPVVQGRLYNTPFRTWPSHAWRWFRSWFLTLESRGSYFMPWRMFPVTWWRCPQSATCNTLGLVSI